MPSAVVAQRNRIWHVPGLTSIFTQDSADTTRIAAIAVAAEDAAVGQSQQMGWMAPDLGRNWLCPGPAAIIRPQLEEVVFAGEVVVYERGQVARRSFADGRFVGRHVRCVGAKAVEAPASAGVRGEHDVRPLHLILVHGVNADDDGAVGTDSAPVETPQTLYSRHLPFLYLPALTPVFRPSRAEQG